LIGFSVTPAGNSILSESWAKPSKSWNPVFEVHKKPGIFAGALFAFSLITVTFCTALILTRLFWAVSPLAGFMVETILIYFCISARDSGKISHGRLPVAG
jgi:cobalamin biosynthesis protein CobD/CbiB